MKVGPSDDAFLCGMPQPFVGTIITLTQECKFDETEVVLNQSLCSITSLALLLVLIFSTNF
eukprot:CCRYP_019525-RA/>CCRYP_019525-RA protein AED:0.00 eAED:0.00 QI:80/1/0.66/1/0/0/3/0/60